MPSTRDYLIATIMGENNRGSVQSQQGILDTIYNRVGDYSNYGASAPTVQAIVTARGGREYNAWMPSDASYGRLQRAFNGNPTGDEAKQYKQASQVVDDFLNNGAGRGMTQGATFYQTPDAPNAWQKNALWPKYGNVVVGDHIYSGPSLVSDKATYQQQNPQFFAKIPGAGTGGFGADYDVSQGLGDPGAGNVRQPFVSSPGSDGFGAGTNAAGGLGDPGQGTVRQALNPFLQISPDDYLSSLNVGGGVQPQGFDSAFGPKDLIGAAYHDFLGRNGSAEEIGSWADRIGQPGSNLSDLIGQIAGSTEGNNLRSSLGLSPYSFSNAGIGTAGGIGNPTPDALGSFGSPFPTANLPTTVPGFSPLPGVDTSAYGMNGGTDAANSGMYGGAGSSTAATPDTMAGFGAITPSVPFSGSLPNTPALPDYAPSMPQLASFDPASYLQQNQDVAAAGADPLSHYLTYGYNEGRSFGPGERLGQGFNAGAYLNANRDVAASVQGSSDPARSALQHYISYGLAEGRGGANPFGFSGMDVSASPYGASALQPLTPQTAGINSFFDYPSINTSVPSPPPLASPTYSDPFSSAGFNGSLPAYQPLGAPPTNVGPMAFGMNNVSQGLGAVGAGSFSNFDPSWYLGNNADVAAAAQASGRDQGAFALDHFINEGIREGRALGPNEWFSGGFDPSGYLAANPDVAAAGANPLQHYLTNGIGEGRSLGDGSTAAMTLSRYRPGTSSLVGSEQSLNVQAATNQINQGIGLSNQTAQTNGATAGQYATPLADALLGDASSAMGRMTNQIAIQNAQEAAALRVPVPAINATPMQTNFYGALPTANSRGFFGGGLPPGAGFI